MMTPDEVRAAKPQQQVEKEQRRRRKGTATATGGKRKTEGGVKEN